MWAGTQQANRVRHLYLTSLLSQVRAMHLPLPALAVWTPLLGASKCGPPDTCSTEPPRCIMLSTCPALHASTGHGIL